MSESFSAWQIRKRVWRRRLLALFFRHIEPFPLAADIEPTTRCNLQCSMCQTRTWNHTGMDLSEDLLLRILEEIPTLQEVKFQGMGEPLLHPRFFDLAALMIRRGIRVSTITNGTLLARGVEDRLAASGLEEVLVSVDSLDETVYRSIRGIAIPENLFPGIERLAARAPASMRTGIATVAMRKNFEEIPRIAERFLKAGIRVMAVQTEMTTWGKDEWKALDKENAPADELAGSLKKAEDLCRRAGAEFRCIANRFLNPGDLCQWPFHRPFITASGDLQPCCKVTDPAVFTFGNLTRTPFSSLWQGAKYRKLRGSFAKKAPFGICKMCFKENC